MCIRAVTCFITSIGQGEPAMIPVRKVERSKSAKSGRPSSAMNIVGTPWRAVQRSSCTARNVLWGSKTSAGTTIVAPWVTAARLPRTIPKQVIERDGDAEAVGLGQPHSLADEEAVVEDRVVRESRPFREAGRPRSVLDIDRIIERLLGLTRGQLCGGRLVGAVEDPPPN